RAAIALAIAFVDRSTGKWLSVRRGLPEDAAPLNLVRALVVGQARSGEAALGRYVAVDAAGRLLMPGNVEGPVFREEAERGIRQVIVDPPGEPRPAALFAAEAVPEAGHDDAGSSAHVAVGV